MKAKSIMLKGIPDKSELNVKLSFVTFMQKWIKQIH
jgi:hypothetical protein